MVFDYTHYTATSTASDVWPTWVYMASASTTTTSTWNTWVLNGNSWAGAAFDPTAQLAQAGYQLAGRDYGQEHAERRRLEQERRSEAGQRARELLLETLDPEQRDSFEGTRQFEVLAPSGNRYRIEFGMQGNVVLLDEERDRVASFCIHPRDDVPVCDVMLAQKLWLETDEEEFCRVANRTELRRPVAA